MVALFKDRSPATIIWLFILSIVVHSHFFVDYPAIKTSPDDGLLSTILNEDFTIFGGGAAVFIYHAIVILQALRLNYIFTDHRMFGKVNYLVATVYILLTGVFTEWSSLTPALITNTMVIWLFAKTLGLYNTPNPKTLLFNIGLLIGISILLYYPSALLLLVAFFAILAVRPFAVNEWLVLPMGVIAPYYFLASYLYLNDKLITITRYIPNWQLNLPSVYITPTFFVTVGILVLVLVIGLVYWQKENRSLLIQVRKNWNILLVMLFIMLPIPFINANAGIESLLLWIVPASAFMAKGFSVPKNNTLPALMFWALLALAIAKNWGLVK